MADSETHHHYELLLPDEIHHTVKPGTALLRLETTHTREGVLDGAWWPRSSDPVAELPQLISVLTSHLGPISRIGLDASTWQDIPTRLVVDGHVVHLVSDPVGDDTVLITRGDNDHFALLVVPPKTRPAAARTAMARAVRADNTTPATQILMAVTIEAPNPEPQAPESPTPEDSEDSEDDTPTPVA